MTFRIIQETYDRLNLLADGVQLHLPIPELAKLCTLYVTSEVECFETVLLRTMLHRKAGDYPLRRQRVFKELRQRKCLHGFIQDYFELLERTLLKSVRTIDSPWDILWHCFWTVTDLYMSNAGCLSPDGCRRRICFLSDKGCICSDPIA